MADEERLERYDLACFRERRGSSLAPDGGQKADVRRLQALLVESERHHTEGAATGPPQ